MDDDVHVVIVLYVIETNISREVRLGGEVVGRLEKMRGSGQRRYRSFGKGRSQDK